MRRLLLLAALLTLAACSSQPSPGVFSDSPSPALTTPNTPAALDLATLRTLRDRAQSALKAHIHDGHLDLSWGSGAASPVAGPYRNDQTSVDALGWVAGAGELRQATLDGMRSLAGPQGPAYLLLARALGFTRVKEPCPSPASSTPIPDLADCLRARIADGLKASWYDAASRSFIHVSEPSTVYRPVEAMGVGAALVVAGYNQGELPTQGDAQTQKIGAGADIIVNSMKSDFDLHYGLAYGLMTASPDGGRQATDFIARVADQAGIAELLLDAFDVSREHQYQDDARQILEPLLDERGSLRVKGYLAGLDLHTGLPSSQTIDVAAGLLVLEAAHHYDRDDGGRFARLEEAAAAAVVSSLDGVDVSQGVPATSNGADAVQSSGLVTALAVAALNDVVGVAAHAL